jgi:hypothetical protein
MRGERCKKKRARGKKEEEKKKKATLEMSRRFEKREPGHAKLERKEATKMNEKDLGGVVVDE